MAIKCYICKREYDKNNKISFHTFPKERTSRIAWKLACKLQNKKVPKAARICSEHFTINNFISKRGTAIKWLQPSAVPSVFFPTNQEDNLTTDDKRRLLRIMQQKNENESGSTENKEPQSTTVINTAGKWRHDGPRCFETSVPAGDRHDRVNTMDISSMLEVQVKEMKMEMDMKENDTEVTARTCDLRIGECKSIAPNSNLPAYLTDRSGSTTSTAASTISQEESTFYKLLFNDIASVRFQRVHCTACNVHIGSAPAQIHNMFEHPVLRTLLCARCREFYGDGTFEQGDDATDMFCRWCANGGNLYCCSYCSNTFCYKCIKRNFTSLIRRNIEEDEKWKCFVCNPRDLYSARAMCWALRQHVETVTRILKNDKKMSAKEIEEKMNLDESQCCTRRSKRKCRRTESNSEDDDETYKPNDIPINVTMKKYKTKVKKYKSADHSNLNGSQIRETLTHPRPVIPIRPRPPQSMGIQPFRQDSSQSRTEQEKQIVKPSEGVVLPSANLVNKNASSLPRYSESNIQLQKPTFYHTFMNNAGSRTYVQVSSTMKSAHHITLPSLSSQPTPSYQPSQLLPQSQSLPNTMVSIPNPQKPGKSRFLLPKPKNSDLTLTPNIIDLDSDSDDELKVVGQQRGATVDADLANVASDKVVPVALTWENSDDDDAREQSLREMSASVEKSIPSFSEVMSPHRQELNKLLNGVKKTVCVLFNVSNATEDVESAAEQKIKQFYRHMRNTILQLTRINDRVMREYEGWTRSRKSNTSSSVKENASVIQSNVEIPLNMTCVNDSETDPDDEEPRYQIKEASDLIRNNNLMKDLLLFRKNVVHCGVGEDTVFSCADKAIQVCNIDFCDYEKYISHSVLNNYSSKTNDDNNVDILKLTKKPVESQKNFSKYEEQFIYYLRHVEDHDIEVKNTNKLMKLNNVPSKELNEMTSSSLSLQDVDLYVSTEKQTKTSEQERNIGNCVNSLSKEEINVPTNAIRELEITNKSNIDIQIAKMKLQESENSATENEVISLISNNNDASSSQNDKVTLCTSIDLTSMENEDCTIIDD